MYKIYSVESRKGGVGKTTVALNLAKVLVDQGNDVLFIDCDITGTPISDAASHSPFWKDIVKPLVINANGSNLIQYFEKEYLRGGGLEMGLAEMMDVEKGKIHLIGSEIYDNNGKLIIDPRLLMDDMHTHWFVEMIIELADVFCEKLKSDKYAVILDNSPGYVGIGKSIREWLTSEGCDRAHFLLVSSLDEQDMESTISSAADISRMMIDKWEIAYLCDQLVNKKCDSEKLDKILDKEPEYRSFFYSLQEERSYPSSLKYRPKISDFVSVVLNKVPNIYQGENMGYKIMGTEIPGRKEVIEALFPLNEHGMPMNTIEYDASISSQFVESNITFPDVSDGKKESIEKVFASFENKINGYSESADKVRKAGALTKAFELFKDGLFSLGYKSIVDSLGEDVINLHYVQDLILFVRALGNVAIPEVDKIKVKRDAVLKADRQMLTDFIKKYKLLSYSSVLYSLFDNIYKKAGFNRNTSNKYLLMNVSLLFRAFLEVQKKQMNSHNSYVKMLMESVNNESVSTSAITDYKWKVIFKDQPALLVNEVVDNLFYNCFVDFYKKMCYTLLRLIDCAEDYRIVLNACQFTIERGGRTMDSNLKNYLKSIVTEKNTEYDAAKFKELVGKLFEMLAIKEMLSKLVLNKR